jgi:prepilin-type processing-associated H-X9-DG protein
MHIAETMWGDDNDNLMIRVNGDADDPDSGTWPGPLSTYLAYSADTHGPLISQDSKDTSANAFRCPKADLSGVRGWEWTWYGYNLYAGANGRPTPAGRHDPVQRGNVSKPEGAVMFIDATTFSTRSDGYFREMDSKNLHSGKYRNMIFVDGHTRTNVIMQQQIVDPNDPTYFYRWAFQSGE